MKIKSFLLALGLTIPTVYATTEILHYRYTYDEFNRIKTVDGPRQDVDDIETYGYDEVGHLTKVTNALGHITERQDFDYLGNPQTLIGPNGEITHLTYDQQGRLKTSTLKSVAGDLTTTYTYDDVTGLVTQITRPDGTETNYEYDTFLRLTATYNGLNERIEYERDAMGNITKETIKFMNGTPVKQHYRVFDELGRLIESISANGKKTAFNYDPNGNRLSITNPLERTSSQAFDALSRLKASTDALNNITALEYNEFDQVRFVKHSVNVTTEYQYDDFGRLITRISPDSGTTTYAYDEANNVIRSEDATGRVTHYTYDALNRVIQKRFNTDETHDYTVTYVYDETSNGNAGIGKLTGVKDAHGVYAYQYDDRGNLVTQIRSTAYHPTTVEHVTRYHYNAANQLEGITYPSGVRINYSYSVLGYVEGITTLLPGDTKAKPLVSNVSYHPYGNITRLTWGNGIRLSRSFDQDYRITGHLATGVDRRHFYYDDNSNISKIDRSANTQQFTYDELDRLSNETGYFGSKAYTYDALDNRLNRTWKHDDQTETQTITYKNNSNQIEKIENNAVIHTDSGHFKNYSGNDYQYDPTGRLKAVYDGEKLKIYNYYDAHGRRIRRVDDSLTQVFYTYSNGGYLLSELSYKASDLQQTHEYVWLGRVPVAKITRKDGRYTITYIHTDHLNTPRVATNDKKEIIWQWESDAFGVGLPNEDVDGDGNLTVISLRFPGQVYDKTTGTYYNVNRDYNPNLGRYIQTDPIGLEGGQNTYTYANSNPVNYADPLGLAVETPWDIANVGVGVAQFSFDLASGNYVGAAISGLGTAYDVLASGVPFLPGGASMAIKACRTANAINKVKRGISTFKGLEVRAQRSLTHIDNSTLKAMQKYGFAAKDAKGNKIILHHHKQNPNGPIIEMPGKNHSIANKRQHPFGNEKGKGLTAKQREEFNLWRVDYWKHRATEEINRRGM